VIRRRGIELQATYRDATSPGGLAFASPQISFVGALILAYGSGLILAGPAIGSRLPVVVVAFGVALVSALVGISVAWSGSGPTAAARPQRTTGAWLPRLGLALVVIGSAALGLYLWRIGAIPLLLPSAEAGRVDAAERGGAALRVLSLLSLPGVWLIVAWASWTRRRTAIIAAILLVAVVAGLQILTANRSPAFQAIAVATVTGVLASGRQRLRAAGLSALAALAIALVLAAGLIGAARLGSALYYGPPRPGEAVYAGPARDYGRLTLLAIRGYAIVPVQNFSYTLEAVPSRIGFQLGYTYVQPVVTVLPGKQTTFDQDLKAALGQRYVGGGTVPSMLGEAYANFGPLGWAIIPFAVGFVTTRLYRLAVAAERPGVWALYGFAILHVSGATVSGLIVASVFPIVAYVVLGAVALIDGRVGSPSARVGRPGLGDTGITLGGERADRAPDPEDEDDGDQPRLDGRPSQRSGHVLTRDDPRHGEDDSPHSHTGQVRPDDAL
jgi:hypothetical protein